MSLLSDGELRKQLLDNGVNVGPITDSTRGLYQKKLLSLKRNGGHSATSQRKVHPRMASSKEASSKESAPSYTSTKRKKDTKETKKQVGISKKSRVMDSLNECSTGLEPNEVVACQRSKLYPTLSDCTSGEELFNCQPSIPLSDNVSPHCASPKPTAPAISGLGYSLPIQSSSFGNDWKSPSPQSQNGEEYFPLSLNSHSMSSDATPSPVLLSPEPELNSHTMADIEDGDGKSESTSCFGASNSVSLLNKKYDWELESSDVVLCKRKDGELWSLGKGGFGVVFKGLQNSVDEVAVKRISLENYHPTAVEQFKREIDLISKLRHRHIVQFYGACIQPTNCYMVTELMDNNLFSILRIPQEAGKYRWSGVYGKRTLIGVALGLNYLHSRRPPVVHRDIKSPNILVMGGISKIADVGIARTMDKEDMTAQNGYSMAWVSPEVIYRRRATEKIDIWSLGIVIWEVVSGRLPEPGSLELKDLPSHLLRLHLSCVNHNPAARPSALEVTTELRSYPVSFE